MKKLNLRCTLIGNKYWLVYAKQMGSGLLQGSGYTVEKAYRDFIYQNIENGAFHRSSLTQPLAQQWTSLQ